MQQRARDRNTTIWLSGLLLTFGCSDLPAGSGSDSTAQGALSKSDLARYDGTLDVMKFEKPSPLGEPSYPPVLDPDLGCKHASVETIAASFNGFDLDGDGNQEIARLEPLSFDSPEPDCGDAKAPLAIVLVEPRLLEWKGSQLLEPLQRHRDDLLAEGFRARFFQAETYRGVLHQDGLSLLALRRFLAAVRTTHAGLTGVTLVGSFPEASLFRRTLFRSDPGPDARMILHPERVNTRAEIVLADLDGRWEELYQRKASMEHLVLRPDQSSWPHAGQFLSGAVLEQEWVDWNDLFYIQDDYVTRQTAFHELGETVWVSIDSTDQRNPELSDQDHALQNPIAQPEIAVSRIDASHVALNPELPPDRFGRLPLDADGHPQELVYDEPPPLAWTKDAALEQRILVDYFARNHAFRRGAFASDPYRSSAVRSPDTGLTSPADFNDYLHQADAALATYGVDLGSHADFVDWLKVPAVLRGIAAHGTDAYVLFGASSASDLEHAVGGAPFAWLREQHDDGIHLRPSLSGYDYGYDWAVGRTLWENELLRDSAPGFFVIGACSVQVTDPGPDVSYDDPTYAYKNIAEVSLFFDNALGVLGRGKVFWDLPSDFGAGFASSGYFGGAWRNAFAADAGNPALLPGANADVRVVNSKKAYFWSTLGDWSARLRYEAE